MDDDLNVAGALAVIWEHLKAGNSAIASEDAPAVARELELVRSMLDVLGLDPLSEQWAGEREAGNAAHGALDTLISAMLADRAAARESKDWARADAIRDQLAAAGIVVEDSPSGATWHLA